MQREWSASMSISKKTRVVEYSPYKVVVSESSAEIGFYRTVLADSAFQEESLKDLDVSDLKALSRRLLHTMLYPAMIASVIEHEGFDSWPITFEEFANLPETFEARWETATYELNPHWRPQDLEDSSKEEDQKKVTKATPD